MKTVAGKNLLSNHKFSRLQLVIFALVFGLIGFFTWRAFAFTLNEVTIDTGICGSSNPSSDPHVTNSATPTFHIDGDGNRASYQAFIDGTSIGTFSVFNAPFADVCVRTTTPLSEGAHSFTATEISPTAGSLTTPNPFSFTVDTIAPAAPSTPLLASFSDSGIKGDNTTKFPNPTLTGTSTPSLGIVLYDNGAAGIGGAGTDSTGAWSARTINLPEGTHPITATTNDVAGNKSPVSGSLALKIDLTPPTGSLSPASGTPVSGTTNLTASAADGQSGVWKVEFQVDGVLKSTATIAPYSYSWDSTSAANGSHTLTAVVHDKADNTFSAVSTVTVQNGTATAPSAPSLNTPASSNGSVSLSWLPTGDGSSAITSYKLYRGTSSGNESLLTSLGNVTSYTDSSATAGSTYYYQVSALNSIGEGTRSSEKSISLASAPSAPALNAPVPGNGSAALSWSAPSSDGGSAVTGYKVYRATTSGAETLLSTLGNISSYTDSGLNNGSTYFYQVSAINSIGEGSKSAERSVTPVTVPGSPILNTASIVNTTISLSWSAPGTNGGSAVTGYRVYRGTSSGSESLLSTLGNTTSFTDSTVLPATTYYYQVSALNTLGEGTKSNERSVIMPDTISPSVSFLSPPNGSTPLSGDIIISAAASDNVAINRVEFYVDSGLVGTAFSTPYQTTWHSASYANGSHVLLARAYDNAGNFTNANMSITTNNADTTPPTASLTYPPDGYAVPDSVKVNITANASDNVGVTQVDFLIDGVLKSTDTTSPYSYSWDSTTVLNGIHSIRAIAYDGAGNPSPLVTGANANQITVTVSNADITKPSIPTGLIAKATAYNQVMLSWNPSSDNAGGSGVSAYYLIKNGVTQPSVGNVTGYTDNAVSGGTDYSYQVFAADGANNFSDPSSPVTVTTPNTPDTTAPSTPNNAVATALSSNQVNLSWNVSTDNFGVTAYEIYRNTTNQVYATVTPGNACDTTTCSYGDATVIANSSYTYYVKAKDAAGNVSPLSNPAPVTTPSAPDTTPPTVPQGVSATSNSSTQVNVSWNASSDPGGTGVNGYKIYRNGSLFTQVGNVTAYVDTAVSVNQTYTYQISARDVSGNESALSTPPASATVQPAQISTGSIAGTLTSAATGAPISGGTVTLTINRHSKVTATTNASGNYTLANLTHGSYSISFSASGYTSKSSTASVSAGNTTTLNIALSACSGKRCR
jgi:fibronectin type 3 domain-containing protein